MDKNKVIQRTRSSLDGRIGHRPTLNIGSKHTTFYEKSLCSPTCRKSSISTRDALCTRMENLHSKLKSKLISKNVKVVVGHQNANKKMELKTLLHTSKDNVLKYIPTYPLFFSPCHKDIMNKDFKCRNNNEFSEVSKKTQNENESGFFFTHKFNSVDLRKPLSPTLELKSRIIEAMLENAEIKTSRNTSKNKTEKKHTNIAINLNPPKEKPQIKLIKIEIKRPFTPIKCQISLVSPKK